MEFATNKFGIEQLGPKAVAKISGNAWEPPRLNFLIACGQLLSASPPILYIMGRSLTRVFQLLSRIRVGDGMSQNSSCQLVPFATASLRTVSTAELGALDAAAIWTRLAKPMRFHNLLTINEGCSKRSDQLENGLVQFLVNLGNFDPYRSQRIILRRNFF